MKKIVYIVFGIDKALEFEWLISEIDTSHFELSFISINPNEETSLKKHCEANQVPFFHIPYTRKRDMLGAILKTRKIINKIKPQIVHSHIFEGGLIGVTAAWLAGIKHRIYTRHYSDFHHVYFRNGLKYDKWINSKSTHIVAVSEVVKNILVEKENVSKKKVSVIHHGIKIDNEESFDNSRVATVKEKYGICSSQTVIGVVSRYTQLKGIQYIIPAFHDLQKENSNLHLVLANAQGDFKPEIARLLKELPKESYTEILFETDNEALFKSFDVFVHVPVSREAEAFGLTYIEALKFSVPSVFTLSGIANEIVKDEENALVVDYQNSGEIIKAVKRLLANEELRIELSKNGEKSVEGFTSMKKTLALEELYERVKS
ncbi:MAG: glycosyltransferase family 4 protein [Brumimicrobium sp.]